MTTILSNMQQSIPERRSAAPLAKKRRWAMPRGVHGYLFLLPWLIGFFGLTLGPTLASLYLSFTNYDLLSAPDWVGAGELRPHRHGGPEILAVACKVTFIYVHACRCR